MAPTEAPFPFVPTPAGLAFVAFILLRVSGLFIISPLLSNRLLNTNIRIFLAVGTTIVLAIVLYPEYVGSSPKYILFSPHYGYTFDILFILLMGIKELAIGYIIGFCFNIIFESMLLAGELIDSMIGFSAAQFLDPFSNTFQSMLGQLFVLTGGMIMIVLDLHHIFIRMIADSFEIIPLGDFYMNNFLVQDVTQGMAQLFIYAVKIGTIPIVILACGLVGIAFTIRVVPEMNILLTGLPMRVLIGFYTIMLAMNLMIPSFVDGFLKITELVHSIVINLGSGQ